MKIFNKLLFLLTPNEQKKLAFLFILTLLTAFLDMLGVVSILPFIGVLLNPEIIETNAILNATYRYSGIFGIETKQQFFFFLGMIVFILLVFSLFLKAITTYLQLRFTKARELTIGKSLIEAYFRQPYSWFINHNSAELEKIFFQKLAQL